MKPVLTISFVTQHNPISGLIRWGTHSDFSHTEVIIPDGYRLGALFAGGVQRRPPDYAKFSREDRVFVPCSPEQAEAFYSFLTQQIGKPYDWTAIAGFAFNRQWRAHDSWFCSELVIAAAEAAKLVKVHTPANRITPNDAFLLLA